ncbi:hypothetical protein [Pontimicrobium sp. MEBiC01747]
MILLLIASMILIPIIAGRSRKRKQSFKDRYYKRKDNRKFKR